MKRRTAMLASALLAASLIGTTALAQPAPRKVSIAISGGQLSMFAPFFAAVGTKAFEKRGIVFEQQNFGSGATAFAAFAGGSTDFAIIGATQVLTAAASGRDLVSMFNMYHGGAVVIMGAKKHQESRGTDIKKYDGLTWGYTAEGTVSHVFMIRTAASAGLDWNKQGKLAVGGIDAYIPTVRSGRVDLITMDMKSAATANKIGVAYPVINTNDANAMAPIAGLQLGLPIVTTRAFATRNAKLMQDISDAMLEGLQAVQKNLNDPDAILRLMNAEFQEANKVDFALQWELTKPAFGAVDGSFTDKALNDTVNFAKAAGQLKIADGVQFDPRKYFDNTWVRQSMGRR